jgi:phospholipid-binding lipoprotein MlaA
MRPHFRLAASMGVALVLAGCAGKPAVTDQAAAGDDEQVNDPYESTNRFFYGVNDKIYAYSIRPLAQGYIYVTPHPVRTGVSNALANLSSPALFANDVAQANPRRAGDTFMRFVINSTVGVVGVFDVAKSVGYRGHDTDFGVTLGLWGVPEGPFLYLPVLGPSSPRGVAGYAANVALDPFTYVPHGYGLVTFNWARFGLTAVDTYATLMPDLDKVKANALDPYATFRSLYRQHVQSQIDESRNDNRLTPPDWTPN